MRVEASFSCPAGVTFADRAANYRFEWGAARMMELPPTSFAGPAGTPRSPHFPFLTAANKHNDATRTASPSKGGQPHLSGRLCLDSHGTPQRRARAGALAIVERAMAVEGPIARCHSSNRRREINSVHRRLIPGYEDRCGCLGSPETGRIPKAQRRKMPANAMARAELMCRTRLARLTVSQ